eukprot:1815935-Rhodomonas_salina.1
MHPVACGRIGAGSTCMLQEFVPETKSTASTTNNRHTQYPVTQVPGVLGHPPMCGTTRPIGAVIRMHTPPRCPVREWPPVSENIAACTGRKK